MNKETIYTFVAILEFTDETIQITFPDIPEALSQADTWDQCYKRANDVLRLSIESRLEDKEEIPHSTSINEISLKTNQHTMLASCIISEKVKFIKKTLTIQEDLNIAAESKGINFSQLLQQALQKKLFEEE